MAQVHIANVYLNIPSLCLNKRNPLTPCYGVWPALVGACAAGVGGAGLGQSQETLGLCLSRVSIVQSLPPVLSLMTTCWPGNGSPSLPTCIIITSPNTVHWIPSIKMQSCCFIEFQDKILWNILKLRTWCIWRLNVRAHRQCIVRSDTNFSSLNPFKFVSWGKQFWWFSSGLRLNF